ncbi:MAG: MMPL family transporter, partial [Gammaproteobacteria bacterium]|nr:MMPL family transporter [Gammaproteobacteria bacterium]
MKTLRDRIEDRFEQFGYWVYDKRLLTTSLMLVLALALILQIPKLQMDTSIEGFLHEDDQIRLFYNQYRDQFGRDEVIFLGFESSEIFSDTSLSKLKDLHNDLETNLPYLDSVESLINARDTRGEKDRLIVDDLLSVWPNTPSEFQLLKKRVQANPVLPNLIISEDSKITALMITTTPHATKKTETDEDILAAFSDHNIEISNNETGRELLTPEQNTELVKELYKIVEKHRAKGMKLYVAGSPIIIEEVKTTLKKDIKLFTVLILLVMSFMLFLLFKRITAVIFPVFVVVLTLGSTLGAMGAMGATFKIPTQLLPQFLLSIGIAASIHLLAIFFRNINLHSADQRRAMALALRHSGLAITMTSVTTAVGLLSFATSEVAPFADLGLYSGLGILLSLLYTLVLLPALYAYIPIKKMKSTEISSNEGVVDRFLVGMADMAVLNAKSIIFLCFIVFLVATYTASKIGFQHNPLEWLPNESDINQATLVMDNKMRGSSKLEIIVDSGEAGGLYLPDTLRRIEQLQIDLMNTSYRDAFIGKTFSIVDILKETHKALNENRNEFYKVPGSKDLVTQELLLFENSGAENMESFVDSKYQKAHITVKTPWLDATDTNGLISEIQKKIDLNFKDTNIDVTVTGMSAMTGRTLGASIDSTKTSYVIATAVIAILMMFMLGGLKIGLYALAPNLLPIVVGIGSMAALGVKFDVFTLLVGSIALGLAVDNTIHTFHNFNRYYNQKDASVLSAARQTLVSTGRAITGTTIVLSTGFFIFMASSMNNLVIFGALTGGTIIFAMLSNFFLGLAILAL